MAEIKWSLRAERDGAWAEVPISAEVLSTDAAAVMPSAMQAAIDELEDVTIHPGFVWVVLLHGVSPTSIRSIYFREAHAVGEAAELNAESGDVRWRAVKWLVT